MKNQCPKWIFELRQREDAFESSHLYSGGFNMVPGLKFETFEVFKDRSEAEDFLAKNAKKWEYAVAVKYRDRSKWTPSKRFKSLKDRLEKAHDELIDLEDSVVKAFCEAKSKTVTCSGCGSKLARAYLKGTACPLCSQNLLSKTARDRVQKKREKSKQTKEVSK